MKRRRHTLEQIVRKLREVERLLGEGQTIAEAAKQVEISEQTYHRWRNLWGAIIPNEANPDSDLPRVRDQSDSLWPEDRTRNEEARDNGEVQAAERDRRDHRQPAHNGEVADERCVFHKRPDSTNRCLEAAVRPPASERTRMRRHATTSGADGARSDLWSHNIGRRFGSPYLACCFGPRTQREFRRDPIMQAHSQRRLTLSSTSVEAGTPTPEITR